MKNGYEGSLYLFEGLKTHFCNVVQCYILHTVRAGIFVFIYQAEKMLDKRGSF